VRFGPHLPFFALSLESFGLAYEVFTSFLLAFFLGKSLAFPFQRELSFALIFLGCPFVQGFSCLLQFFNSRDFGVGG